MAQMAKQVQPVKQDKLVHLAKLVQLVLMGKQVQEETVA